MTVVETFRGGAAGAYHGRQLPERSCAHVWRFAPAAPALVLGSTQSESLVESIRCAELGIEIVRRRSGGGVVLLAPGQTIWIDVLLPAGHPLWRTDIGESALWLGDAMAETISRFSGEAYTVHRGAMERSPWSSLVCFAGRGPGEVFDRAGSKVVGISQRRTRGWARFQCVVSRRWNPGLLVDLLRPPRPASQDLAFHGADLDVDEEDLAMALMDGMVRVLDVGDDSLSR